MSKFVTVSYYRHVPAENDTVALYGNGSADKPFRITLNIDSIMSIDRKSQRLKTYDSREQCGFGRFIHSDVSLLKTSAGADGSYYLTPESIICLMEFLEPVSA